MTEKSNYTGLAGRTALVTGAAQGIGYAVVRRFAEAGCTVLLMDRTGSPVYEASDDLAKEGFSCLAVEGDVTSAEDWVRATALAREHFGPVTILVNNAGISGSLSTSIMDYDEETFDRVIDVNVKGVFLGTKYCAREMIDTGGAIINLSSVSGFGGHGRIIAYTASKHAVNGMTKSAATELTPLGIRVNAVCPSPTFTPMIEAGEKLISPDDPELARKAFNDSNPMSRYAEPSEIADVIAYLASDQSSYVSGALVPVDGGAMAS